MFYMFQLLFQLWKCESSDANFALEKENVLKEKTAFPLEIGQLLTVPKCSTFFTSPIPTSTTNQTQNTIQQATTPTLSTTPALTIHITFPQKNLLQIVTLSLTAAPSPFPRRHRYHGAGRGAQRRAVTVATVTVALRQRYRPPMVYNGSMGPCSMGRDGHPH